MGWQKWVVGISVAVALALSGGLSGRAMAQESAAPDDDHVRHRLERLQSALDQRNARAQTWQYGWMGLGYAVTAGFTVGAMLTDNKTNRLDFAFAAGGALVDTTVHTLDPIKVHAAARVRALPDGSPEQARIKLKFAEAELAAAALAEFDRQSLLKAHILPNGVPVITGLVLWLGFGHLKGAVTNTIAAVAINEIRVLTQPMSATHAWSDYQRDPDGQIAVGATRSSRVSWSVAFGPFSSCLFGRF